jgi:hypothetical protein
MVMQKGGIAEIFRGRHAEKKGHIVSVRTHKRHVRVQIILDSGSRVWIKQGNCSRCWEDELDKLLTWARRIRTRTVQAEVDRRLAILFPDEPPAPP